MFSSALKTVRVCSPLARYSLSVTRRGGQAPHLSRRSLCSSKPKVSTAPLKAKKSNTKYYVAGGLLFFGVVCAEDMYNYPDGLLSQSELFPYIADTLSSMTDSFNDALQPTSDELLPEWPTAPCYAGMVMGNLA